MTNANQTVIGLEVHAELSTKSKIFCGCSTEFGGEANTRVCPVCAGLPGTLPLLNRTAVEYAVLAGLALNCSITRHSKFDRKNYFYPDLPKAYQVSQLYAPVCTDGCVEIKAAAGKKTIRIREIHIEEDAGKLIHAPDGTYMDFNRCGVPLIEIVTQPDFTNAAEVVAYLEHLRETLLYLGVCDCKMQEGSLRADVNLSVCGADGSLGVRTEMKNLNSFKAITRAIEYEEKRQREILKKGGQITQDTLRWDDEAGCNYSMRSKENAPDYKYFPEPDLLPLHISDDWLSEIRAKSPELAAQKRERYINDYNIPENTALQLTAHKNIAALFEGLTEKTAEPIEAANLITGEIMRLVNADNASAEDLTIDEQSLARLITLVTEGEISRAAYKQTIEAVYTQNAAPDEYIEAHGLKIQTDSGAVSGAVCEVLEQNLSAVDDYKNGKQKAFGFLMGQVMRRLGAAASPEAVKTALEDALGES